MEVHIGLNKTAETTTSQAINVKCLIAGSDPASLRVISVTPHKKNYYKHLVEYYHCKENGPRPI